MHPILYEYSIFGYTRPVAGYGLMLAWALIAGMCTVMALAHRRRLDVVDVLLVALIAIVAGLVGSYLLFVITMLPAVLVNPSVLLAGGLVFYGGPIAAVPAAYIAARRLNLPPLKLADIAAPALALGHASGRLGCFLGGCCFGGKSDLPWAVVFSNPLSPASLPPLPRHPVQLYESLVLLLISLATLLLWRRTRGDGRLAFAYLIAYSIWRFVVETMRDDVIRGYLIPGLLTTSQTISLLLVPAGIAGIIWLGRRARA